MLTGRKWRSQLKSSMRYLGRVDEQEVSQVLHWLKDRFRQHYRAFELEMDYGEGVDRACLERHM